MNRPLFIVGIGLAIFACCLPAYSIQGPEGGGAAPTTITHDGGFGTSPVVFTIDPVPFTSNPPLQFNNTILGAGGNQSTATAGNGYYFDSNRFDAIIAPGTSLSQAAPAGGNTPASLKLEFYDSTYMTGGWDNLVGYYNLPLTGDIPLGSSVECILDVTLSAVIVPAAEDKSSITIFLSIGHELIPALSPQLYPTSFPCLMYLPPIPLFRRHLSEFTDRWNFVQKMMAVQ